jgi:hypothetical protein
MYGTLITSELAMLIRSCGERRGIGSKIKGKRRGNVFGRMDGWKRAACLHPASSRFPTDTFVAKAKAVSIASNFPCTPWRTAQRTAGGKAEAPRGDRTRCIQREYAYIRHVIPIMRRWSQTHPSLPSSPPAPAHLDAASCR